MNDDAFVDPIAASYRAAVEEFEIEQNRLANLHAMHNRLARPRDFDDAMLRAAPRPMPQTRPSPWPLILAVVVLGVSLGLVIGISLERAWTTHNAVEVMQ